MPATKTKTPAPRGASTEKYVRPAGLQQSQKFAPNSWALSIAISEGTEFPEEIVELVERALQAEAASVDARQKHLALVNRDKFAEARNKAAFYRSQIEAGVPYDQREPFEQEISDVEIESSRAYEEAARLYFGEIDRALEKALAESYSAVNSALRRRMEELNPANLDPASTSLEAFKAAEARFEELVPVIVQAERRARATLLRTDGDRRVLTKTDEILKDGTLTDVQQVLYERQRKREDALQKSAKIVAAGAKNLGVKPGGRAEKMMQGMVLSE
jgi:hypothetical protein